MELELELELSRDSKDSRDSRGRSVRLRDRVVPVDSLGEGCSVPSRLSPPRGLLALLPEGYSAVHQRHQQREGYSEVHLANLAKLPRSPPACSDNQPPHPLRPVSSARPPRPHRPHRHPGRASLARQHNRLVLVLAPACLARHPSSNSPHCRLRRPLVRLAVRD